MKKAINLTVVSVLVVLLIVGSVAPVVGTEYDIVVTGMGVYPDDVEAVQSAVDNYSRILLRGTFDFGDWGTVAVTADDVEIRGERVGEVYNTRIMGGQIPFLVGSSATGPYGFLNPAAIAPVNNFAIEDIYFENAMSAIVVPGCHGELTIAGNKIVDGRPFDFGGWPVGLGISVGPIPTDCKPENVTANTVIRENYIDGRAVSWPESAGEPWAVCVPGTGRCYRGLSIGIYFHNANAHADIVGNEVVDTFVQGISIENSSVLSEQMSATVTGNTITPSAAELSGNGLTAWVAKVHFAHNTVNVANPQAWGVACASCYDSVIEKNNISYSNGWLGGISLLVDDWNPDKPVTGNLVRNNRITGEASFAIAVAPAALGGTATAENNTFVGNNVNLFTPDPTVWGFGAHYVLMEGANENLVVGNGGDVIDEGVGNVITGLTKKPGNVGELVKEALHRGRAW